MNITNMLTRGITARLVAGITMLSLLLSALPVAFFIAYAASNLYTDAAATIETTSPYATGAINAAAFSDLTLSFSYDSTELDATDDSFSYGWRTVGGSNNPLGTINGLVGVTAAEIQSVLPITLPVGAQVTNLEIYIEVTALPGGGSDQVFITNLNVSGDAVADAVDVCPEISGDQASTEDCDPPTQLCPDDIGIYPDCEPPTECLEGFALNEALTCVPVDPPTPAPADASISATKIVCDYEALLPNDGYTSIGASTAADFLASTPERTAGCRLLPDWNFQWALDGQDVLADNLGAQDAPWVTSGVTNELGKVTMVVPGTQLAGNPTISVREVMKENFIQFTGRNNTQNISAELYCGNDAANYDNLEWIAGVAPGSTHHCVAWNVSDDNQKPVTTISEPINGLSTTTDFRITIRSTDDKQLEKMVINLKNEDGSHLSTCLNEVVNGKDQTRSCVVDVSELGEGNFQFKANARDTGGNISNTIIQTFTIGSAPAPKCLNLLTNGSFEAEANTVIDPNLWQKFASVAGWAITKVTGGDATTLELHNGWSGNQAADGAQYAELDGDHSTKITQTVTTIPGATYELKWAFAGRHAIDAEQNKLSVLIDGSEVATEGPVNGFSNLLPASWDRSSYLFTADGSTDISFADAGASDSYGTFLDDAQLCLVREPELVATIVAEKVVCNSAAALPQWNDGLNEAGSITSTTAADWVAQSEGACRLVPDWQFEWAPYTANDAGDTTVGAAGGLWTTFGSTNTNGKTQVTLTEAQIGNGSYVWMREVLKDGYLPFNKAAKNNAEDEDSAEIYCHTDGVNYDNFDRVDGISVGNTYHCVAFNYELPKPVEQCELTMYSDEGTVVAERNGYAVETYDGNPDWKASIPGATWIWDSYEAAEIDNEESETFTFEESFTVNNPTFADLDIAADNDYEISVNGVVKIPFANDSHFGLLSQDDINVLPYLANGNNVISIKVKNFGATNDNYLQNPAGLLYKLVVKGDNDESCEVTTAVEEEPTPKLYRIDGYKYQGNVELYTPRAQWTINLLDDEGEVVKSTTTDATGYYYFDVLAGDYEVHEEILVGWEQNAVISESPYAIETDEETGIQNCQFVLPGRLMRPLKILDNEGDQPIIVEQYDATCTFYNTVVDNGDDTTPTPEVDGDSTSKKSSGGTKVKKANRLAPAVLGAATSQCGMYLFDYMRQGIANEGFEVTKLQWFLVGQGYPLMITGVFDSATDAAVREFQKKHQIEVLTPWFKAGFVPHENPTGWVYQLTRWKINNIVCPGSEVLPTLLP